MIGISISLPKGGNGKRLTDRGKGFNGTARFDKWRKVTDTGLNMTTSLSRRRMLWIELGVVMILYIIPAIWSAAISYSYPTFIPRSTGWYEIIHRFAFEAGTAGVVLFLAWNSGDALSCFGIRLIAWWRAVPICLGCLLCSLMLHRFMPYLLLRVSPDFLMNSRHVSFLNRTVPPHEAPQVIARGSVYFVGAFLEEFVMRGYLIYRLTELLGKSWSALVISSFLFAAYHIYEGPASVVTVFFVGLTYGTAVLVSKSVWPSTIAHATYNILNVFARV